MYAIIEPYLLTRPRVDSRARARRTTALDERPRESSTFDRASAD